SAWPSGLRALLVLWRCATVRRSARRGLGARLDPHPVEGAVDEDERETEEDGREDRRRRRVGALHLLRELDGEEAEERRELDDRVERDARRVLEGVTDGVADDRCVVKRRALRLELDLDDLLRVVPRATGVRHEEGLEEAEEGDPDEVADEEERVVE